MAPEKEWLSRKEAAEYLRKRGCDVTPRSLEKMASNNNAGKGPAFTRLRWKTVRYRKGDLDAWLEREAVRVE